MAAGDIRAGRAYVEIGANDKSLVAGLNRALARVQVFARTITSVGQKMQATGQVFLKYGTAASVPFAAGAKAFASYEQALADLRAAANPTAAQFDRIKAAIDQVSDSTGNSRPEVAKAFGELLKAGMPLETVLGGAAEAAIKFAKVGEMDVATAATTMNDALNVFAREGLTATQAIDTLSKAADASSVSIEQITQAFAMSAAVYGDAGLTMGELTSAIGLLGNAGVKGSDAGTALKTMLMMLRAPTAEGAAAMSELGINVRDAAGNMLPMREMLGRLQTAFAGLDPARRDSMMKTIFGADAIRASSILLQQGVKGWDAYQQTLGSSLSVAQKFAIQTNTLEGNMARLWTGVRRVGEEIGAAIGGQLSASMSILQNATTVIGRIVQQNPQLVATVAAVAGAAVAIGGVLIVVGTAATHIAAIISGLATLGSVMVTVGAIIGTAIVSPLGIATIAVAGLVAYIGWLTGTLQAAGDWIGRNWSAAMETLYADFESTWAGIRDAIISGDIAKAAEVVTATIRVVWQRGMLALLTPWQWLRDGIMDTIGDLWTWMRTTALTIGNTFRGLGLTIIQTFAEPVANAMAAVVQSLGAFKMAAVGIYGQIGKAVGYFTENDVTRMNKIALADYDRPLQIARDIKNYGKGVAAAADEASKREDAQYRVDMYNARLANVRAKQARAEASAAEVRQAEADLAAAMAARDQVVQAAARQRTAAEGRMGGPAMPDAPGIPKGPALPVNPGPAVDDMIRSFSSRGTFSAIAASMLGGPSDPAKKTADNTAKLVDLVRELNSAVLKGFTFG